MTASSSTTSLRDASEPNHPVEEAARATPSTHGWVRDGWYVEEDQRASRLGIRIQERLHHERSRHQDIAVYQTAWFGRFLTLDDIIMFTERDEFVYHEMLTHVPLLSHPDPRSVLIIGGGDCGCLREVLAHPGVERVVQCELDRAVTDVCERFFDWVGPARADPRAELVFDDGIRHIESHPAAFDVVIIDSTDPIGPSVPLFSRDFYELAARALKPGGIMTAQTESPHWSARLVGAIYDELRASFAHVFPYLGWLPTYASGSWSWAFASNTDALRDPAPERIDAIEKRCLYYNRSVHRAAFALPTFAQRAVEGDNPFARFERRHIEAVDEARK